MKPILNILDPNNWRTLYVTELVALPIPSDPRYYYALDTIQVPLLVTNHVLAIVPTTYNSKPYYKWAGTAIKKVQTGITVGGNYNVISERKPLWLNQTNLVRFDPITASYALEIQPSWKLKDIKLEIFAYIGQDSDTVTEQLNRIESAIGQLNPN